MDANTKLSVLGDLVAQYDRGDVGAETLKREVQQLVSDPAEARLATVHKVVTDYQAQRIDGVTVLHHLRELTRETRTQEYQVPVMFDVTATSREEAGKAVVQALSFADMPGVQMDSGRIESWWTIEAIDKDADGNDNAAGTVTFD